MSCVLNKKAVQLNLDQGHFLYQHPFLYHFLVEVLNISQPHTKHDSNHILIQFYRPNNAFIMHACT